MSVKFSRTLGAIACAALALGLSSHNASAQEAWAGYHGRPAGSAYFKGPQTPHTVNVYRGGAFAARPRAFSSADAASSVTVYRGGGGTYVNYAKVPEYLEGLEVVTVTRGAGPRVQAIDAICAGPNGERMPAARTRRTTTLDGAVELFRCEDGLALRGFVNWTSSGAQGYEVVCDHRTSLWHSPDGGVSCKPKARLECWTDNRIAACDEAALRHAFGVGQVLAGGPRQRDHAAVVVTRGLSLTGGVGYPPF